MGKGSKSKNGRGTTGFLNELGPFVVVYRKKWQISAHSVEIVKLFGALKRTGYFFKLLEPLKVTER